MPEQFHHFSIERDERGIVTVWFDAAGSPVNLFSDDVFAELARIVDDLEQTTPRLVVFRSKKPSGFLAGADVRRIAQIATPDEARAAIEAGWKLFDRINRLPALAVIHGVCLGGGLEFALACRHRIARDDASTRMGLPETQLGLIPGWGGTLRLPRLVGVRAALRMILEGSKISALEAERNGLIDRAIPAENFEQGVEKFIADLLAGKPIDARTQGLYGALLDGTWFGRHLVFREARKAILNRAAHYPALSAAIAAVKAGQQRSAAVGVQAEREGFARLLFSDTARSLLDLFFEREKAVKVSTWVSREESSAKERTNIRRVAVVGGGVMGSGIAQLAALSGYEVVLKELTPELAQAGMKRIEELTVDAVKKGIVSRSEAEARLRTVTHTSEWGPLQNADLVIEAVVERDDVKRALFSELGRQLPPEAILTTNTSSLTVGRVCEPASNQLRTAGLHFFNPVHRMQLVEVVRGPETDSRTVGALVEFVRKLGKVPVVVADGPGFLVNRVLFPYLDEAVRMLEAGFLTNTIDRAAVSFGMPMGPLELLDQVGLDVAAEVARSLQVTSNDPSPTPARLSEMAKSGFLGRKSGSGFYHWKNGRRRQPNHRGESSITYEDRSMKSGAAGPGALSFLQQRLLYPMVNEAAHCLELGTADASWIVDLAMVLGTGFAPYLGGPLRAADHWGIKQVVADMDRLHRACGDRFEPCALLREMSRNGRSFYPMTEHASAVSASMGS